MNTRDGARTQPGMPPQKKTYVAPQLVAYGQLKNLTASGTGGMEGTGKDGGDPTQKA